MLLQYLTLHGQQQRNTKKPHTYKAAVATVHSIASIPASSKWFLLISIILSAGLPQGAESNIQIEQLIGQQVPLDMFAELIA